MSKRISLFTLPLLAFFLFPQTVYAQVKWTGDCIAEGDVATIRGIVCIVKNLLSPLPALIILAAFFMVILAGGRIISAGGDAKALASAWSQFRWAVIGIILLSAAWLVLLTIERFTGAPVTEFGIPK